MPKGKPTEEENGRKATYADEKVNAHEVEIAAETLRGDVRDAMLSRIHNLQRPWKAMTEDQQAEVAAAMDQCARDLVTKATQLIAANGRKTITATVDSITVKDGIKVVAKVPMTEESLLSLGLAQGHAILIVAAASENYDGERGPAHTDPDQQSLAA